MRTFGEREDILALPHSQLSTACFRVKAGVRTGFRLGSEVRGQGVGMVWVRGWLMQYVYDGHHKEIQGCASVCTHVCVSVCV